jgi:hypothetical protein
MGAYELTASGSLGSGLHNTSRTYPMFNERALKHAQSMRVPATTDYDRLWDFFIASKNDGGTSLNVTPYWVLAHDCKNRAVASPLNLMIIGDADNLDEAKAKSISLFLDFFERLYGEVNLTVVITKPVVLGDKFDLVERPRDKGGLGGIYIHLPMGNDKDINPQLIVEKIKEAVLRPNSPLRKMKFKTRIED